MRLVSLLAILLVLVPSCLNAQPGTVPENGSRLRLKLEGKNGTCLLDHIVSDTLYVSGLEDGQLTPIAFGRVERAQVRVRRSAGWGALRGLVIGGATGAAVGMAVGIAKWGDMDTDACGVFDEICDDTFGAWQMVGYITLFGFAGMGAGGIIGAVAPGHRWKTFELPQGVSMGVQRGNTFVVQYKRSF